MSRFESWRGHQNLGPVAQLDKRSDLLHRWLEVRVFPGPNSTPLLKKVYSTDMDHPQDTDSLGRTIEDLKLLPYPTYTKEDLAVLRKIFEEEIRAHGFPGRFRFKYNPQAFDNQETFIAYLERYTWSWYPGLVLHAPFKELPNEIVPQRNSINNAMYRSLILWRLQLGV